jgi:hypothetical protein
VLLAPGNRANWVGVTVNAGESIRASPGGEPCGSPKSNLEEEILASYSQTEAPISQICPISAKSSTLHLGRPTHRGNGLWSGEAVARWQRGRALAGSRGGSWWRNFDQRIEVAIGIRRVRNGEFNLLE